MPRPRPIPSFLAALALLLLASCRSSPRLRPLNLVLVTIDTLRADRLGCYGHRDVETPNLDRLAQRGALFENATAQAPLTAPSHASMMTGLEPYSHKVRDTGGFVLSSSDPTLAAILEAQGWDTAAFVGATVLKKRFGFSQGFAVYDDAMAGENAERRAGEVVDRALQWIGSRSGRPYFLWVHVFDPHLPYDPPAPFRQKYATRPYDGEVAYTDQQLGRLFDAVGRKSPPDTTLIAVLSDHGESFGEHGEYAHGVFLYDTTLRVPFLLAGPGVPPGVRVKQQARTIDLLPTVLELLGEQAPHRVEGRSLVASVRGGDKAPPDSYAETLFPKLNMGWAELRSLRTGRWKFIRAPRPELYDLSQDPGETTNVIARHPAEARDLERKLAALTRGAKEKVEPAKVDPKTLAQLKSLGYLGGSSPRAYELTGEGVDPKDRVDVLKLLHQAAYAEPALPADRQVSMLRAAIAKDPRNPALYSNLGDLYRKAGRQREEFELYQQAVNRGIDSAWLHSRLGSMYLAQGKNREATAFLELAARENPSDYASVQNLAALYRQAGRLDEAGRLLEAIVKSGEEYAPAYNELGMVKFQQGDLAAARGYFEKAAALAPTYQLNLGRLYKTTGDIARARASFEAFLAVAGSRPEYRQLAAQARQELAALREEK